MPGQLGKVTGLAQGAASLSRAIGPALGGSIWAWSCSNLGYYGYLLIFGFLQFLTIAIIAQSFWLTNASDSPIIM